MSAWSGQRPATLELLFARAAQGDIFLLLAAGGAAVGLLLQLAGLLHRVCRPAGMAADVLCALIPAAMLLYAAFRSGDGLRGYALLGLFTGVLLYRTGVQPVTEQAARMLQKLFRRRQE
ncbi:MAG: hypothetical protein IJ343_06350 [Clostridia bacterium]|nr:hypothetical protein [Clostridia bacterium]